MSQVKVRCPICEKKVKCDKYPLDRKRLNKGFNIPVWDKDEEWHIFRTDNTESFFIHFKLEGEDDA